MAVDPRRLQVLLAQALKKAARQAPSVVQPAKSDLREMTQLLHSRERSLDLSRPHIMGILNLTPDSFSDGGLFNSPALAIERALNMVEEGATLIDLGAESTRPGALPVSVQQEVDRLLPVLSQLRKQTSAWLSIDTSSPEVMRLALEHGADLINDVRSFQRDGALDIVVRHQAAICLMHMRGEPGVMQKSPSYDNVTQEVVGFLNGRIADCLASGITRSQMLVDPGFGFGKSLEHNYQLLRELDRISAETGCPVLAGISRKSMIGQVLNKPVTERLYGSVAAATLALTKGAKVLRVHDVAATADALKVASMMLWSQNG